MEHITTIKSALRSGHHTGTNVTGLGLALTEDVRGETGRVDLTGSIDASAQTILKFKKEYHNPVVVAYIVTRNLDSSVDVRVKDVTPTQCTLFMEEPSDGKHGTETVSYIVIEAGSHITLGGYRIEAGLHNTANSRRGGMETFSGDYIKFVKLFAQTPVVLHTLNTYKNETFATTMVQKVTTDGFEIAQEFAETKKASAYETVAWIAFEPMSGKGHLTDVRGEVGIVNTGTNAGVENKKENIINFKSGFSNRPDIVVKGQSMNGADGYWARGAGAWTKELVKIYAEEDQQTDNERLHGQETFGYAAFDANSLIRTIRPFGDRVSDVFDLGSFNVSHPLITTWKTNNYSKVSVQVKVSANYGAVWSDWLPCAYAKTLPGISAGGDLSGYFIQFKYIILNDIDVVPYVTEFLLMSGTATIVVEGVNVGGYATDGSDWNAKRVL
jgi:hypothetical protein